MSTLFSNYFKSLEKMMQKEGLEPSWYHYHTDLNRARLPIPPFSHIGGWGWIRTIEVCDGRFTVCSLWPLGNPPI